MAAGPVQDVFDSSIGSFAKSDTGVVPEPHRSIQLGPILKQLMFLIGAQGGIGLCGFMTGTLSARLLGPSARGQLAAIQIASSLLATFATLGLSDAITLYCARDPRNARSHVISSMLLSTIAGSPVLLAGYMVLPYLLRAQDPAVIQAARWYLLVAVFYVLFSFSQSAMRGRQDFALWSASRYLTPAATLFALAVAWLTGRITPQFIALFGLAMMGLMAIPSTLFILMRRLSGTMRPRPDSWMPMLRFSVPLVASALPKQLNLRLDQMVMAALLPPRLLGLYVVAAAWSTMTGPIFEGLSAFLFPHVASHGSVEGQALALVQFTKFATPIALLEVIVFSLITPWGLTLLFGNAYRQSVPSALVLVVAAATLYLGQMLEEGLRGLGKPMPILWAELGGLLITAFSLAALMKPMGIIGAAISSLLGYTVVWSILVNRIRAATGFSFAQILLPSTCDIRRGWMSLCNLCWNT